MLKLIIFINLVFEKNKLLRIVRRSLLELPSPIIIRYMWNFGSLLGVCLILQIARGLLLALSYNCDIGTAFFRVDAIMRELPRCGWLFRSIHSNGARIFFVFIYLHIARGLYYRSFNFSYILLIERSILLLIIGAAFFRVRSLLGSNKILRSSFTFYFNWDKRFTFIFFTFKRINKFLYRLRLKYRLKKKEAM